MTIHRGRLPPKIKQARPQEEFTLQTTESGYNATQTGSIGGCGLMKEVNCWRNAEFGAEASASSPLQRLQLNLCKRLYPLLAQIHAALKEVFPPEFS